MCLVANKQKLYDVYGQVVRNIEEFEQREYPDIPFPKSNIAPDQSGITTQTVCLYIILYMHVLYCYERNID